MADDTQLAYEPQIQRVLNSRDETRSYYNKIAKIYDMMAESSEGPMCDIGLQLLAVQPGEHVLELGFGTGHAVVKLANSVGPTGKVFGIDISDKMVELTQQLVAKQGLADRVQLSRGDAEHLDFADGSLDAVFTSFTLELFDTPDLPKVLGECRRVLKPGGRLGVVAVSHDSPPTTALKIYEWSHKHFPNLVDCRPIYVRNALEANGFTITQCEKRNMWVPVEIVVGEKA
jgi:demethylmenaquinone methyltransferase/2-methoxy-6-polyprenyl-1,4-benzoquinol methylase